MTQGEAHSYRLSQSQIVELARVPHRDDREAAHKLYNDLPTPLSPEGVASIGWQVSTFVEGVSPSADGQKHGKNAERESKTWIGTMALAKDDITTAESVAINLGSFKWSVRCMFSSLYLKRQIARRRQNPLQTP